MTLSESVWAPDPSWQPVTGGTAGAGIWLAETGRRPLVVKRLTAPEGGDPAELSEPRHAAWWRREADVALDGSLVSTSGLRAPVAVRVDEDATGITLWSARVPRTDQNGLYLARALGAFAGNDLAEQGWWCRDLLAGRLRRLEDKGGWPTLRRTTLADVADRLWGRRTAHLQRLAELPQVPGHGDPTPANLPGRHGQNVVAVDWSSFGSGPVGADLGYLALSVREDLDVLLIAYAEGLGVAGLEVDLADVRAGATVMAGYTALSRAEWALARAAAGPGALSGKYRHPAVAPYLRSLQRLFPQLENLL